MNDLKKYEDKQISVNGININFTDSGGNSTPLIFVHGFPFNKESWSGQLEAFSNDFRVILYDIRGFGSSEAGNEPFRIKLFADDLIQLMDALKIKNAYVCGLSMGGYIILNAIDRYPEYFQSIILCDTQCNADTEEGKTKRFKTMEEIQTNGLEEFTEGFLKNIFHKETFNIQPAIVQKIKSIVLSTAPTSVINTLKALAERAETCSHLQKINVPTLIICGKDDKITPPEKSEFLQQNIPNAQLRLLDQAAHLSNMEQPESFNTAIKEFLGDVESGKE